MPASFELVVGPPASGKTTVALDRVRDAVADGERVWWVGLPHQRAATYRRATAAGAVLGLDVLSSQQLYYRLLSQAAELRPLIVGTGRIAWIGRALAEFAGAVPAPGEARLFTAAVAEAKRFGLGPGDLAPHDPETERLQRVFAAYERLKGERWDYDDYRLAAFRMLHGAGGAAPNWPGFAAGTAPDRIVFDGYRELGPLELAIAQGLATTAGIPVLACLPEVPPGLRADRELPPRDAGRIERLRAPNPVAEARWVMRGLKRDLAAGIEPLDLAVIVPDGDARPLLSLADEYGVPFMDETPSALADTRAGRRLLDLLELAEQPTASRLLAVPELQPLASAALARGVAGREAIDALARDLGLSELWTSWSARLAPDAPAAPNRPPTADATPADADELAWARARVEQALEDVPHDEAMPASRFRDHALERAAEARSLARGAHFRAWWAALLQETVLFDRPRGGVALLGPTQASGRRFRRAYLMGAVEGAYGAGEAEDYFVPEEHRQPWEAIVTAPGRAGLPRRFRGRDRAVHAELLTRADELVVSYADGDQGGRRAPEPALVGAAPAPLPPLPAGSRLERADGETYMADLGTLELGDLGLEDLRRYDICSFRGWAVRRALEGDPEPWRDLVRDLRALEADVHEALDDVAARHPDHAEWLARHREQLAAYRFGVDLPSKEGPGAYLDGARRSDRIAHVLRFVAPGSVRDPAEARVRMANRWNERWAAHILLQEHARSIDAVHLWVWPVGGEPIDAYPTGVDPVREGLRRLQRDVGAAQRGARSGRVVPEPGYHCRSCAVIDVCRIGGR